MILVVAALVGVGGGGIGCGLGGRKWPREYEIADTVPPWPFGVMQKVDNPCIQILSREDIPSAKTVIVR